MRRLPEVILALFLSAFTLIFLLLGCVAPDKPPMMHFIAVVVTLLLGAATAVGAFMAWHYVVTGRNDYL